MIFSSRLFLQKTNKRILLYYYETSGWLVFVFWRKLKTPKRHFEINWPLGCVKYLGYIGHCCQPIFCHICKFSCPGCTINPNWHEGGHLPPPVLFWSDFVSWIFIKNLWTFLEVKIDINRAKLTPCQTHWVLWKNVPRWR